MYEACPTKWTMMGHEYFDVYIRQLLERAKDVQTNKEATLRPVREEVPSEETDGGFVRSTN